MILAKKRSTHSLAIATIKVEKLVGLNKIIQTPMNFQKILVIFFALYLEIKEILFSTNFKVLFR